MIYTRELCFTDQYKKKHKQLIAFDKRVAFDILTQSEHAPSVGRIWAELEQVVDVFVVDLTEGDPHWELHMGIFIQTKTVFI